MLPRILGSITHSRERESERERERDRDRDRQRQRHTEAVTEKPTKREQNCKTDREK